VKTEVGYVNLLVANAGIMGPRPLKASPGQSPPTLSEFCAHALATPMDVFTDTYSVNTTAVYYSALAFLELLDAGNTVGNMGANWKSQVIATSSIGGFSRLKGASFAYNSSKAATTHLMKMMATSLVPYKIRCNVLAPGSKFHSAYTWMAQQPSSIQITVTSQYLLSKLIHLFQQYFLPTSRDHS
jgi:NAD(P)-dependent dehydrogenase (short-subunit alcohol dehydrogenase family)